MKIDPHYRQRRCSPMTLVSRNMFYADIRGEFPGEDSTDDSGVIENGKRTKCPLDKMPPAHTGTKWPLPEFYNKYVCSVFPVKVCLFVVEMNKKTTFTPVCSVIYPVKVRSLCLC